MRRPRSTHRPHPTGSSYLEVQVAMVLLSIGIGGMYSLSVIQTRQTARLEEMLPADQIASINPIAAGTANENAWAKKLGVYAEIETDSVAAPQTLYPRTDGYFRILDNEWWGFSTYEAPGSEEWDDYGGYSGDNQLDVEELDTEDSYGSYAEFNITGVPQGDYEILLYCPRQPFFGTAVTHQIFDGATLIDTVPVDQTVAKEDVKWAGRWWQRLGVYTITQSSVSVRVLDTPVTGDKIIADAIIVRSRRSFRITAPVASTTGGGASISVELN